MTLPNPSRSLQQLEAIGRLSPVVAHDINNLLSGILGYSQILLGDPAAAGLKPYIEEIEHAGKRIAALARILQLFHRKLLHHEEPLDMPQEIRAMGKFLSAAAGPDIHFAANTESAIPPVWADKARLRQILLTLVIDARNLLPQGGWLELDAIPAGHHPEFPEGMGGGAGKVWLRATIQGCLDSAMAAAYPPADPTPAASTQPPQEAGDAGGDPGGLSEIVAMCGGQIACQRVDAEKLVVWLCLPAADALPEA